MSTSTIPDRQTQIALQNVIERLFESCLREGRYRQVVGIAVEARNLEVLRRVIKRASDDEKKAGKHVEGTGPTEELMEYVLGYLHGRGPGKESTNGDFEAHTGSVERYTDTRLLLNSQVCGIFESG